MRINLDKNVVELRPESDQETVSLETLWKVLIDCVKETKHLTPIGEYLPQQKENMARFVIEGVPGGKTVMSETLSQEDCTYLCATCNKYIHVCGGETIPLCCGMVMKAAD